MGLFPSKLTISAADPTLFLIKSSKKSYLLGTLLEEDSISRFDDFDILGTQSLLRIYEIQFFVFEKSVIGYESRYVDQFDKKVKVMRLPKKFKK